MNKPEQISRPVRVGIILSAPIREYQHLFDRLARRSDIAFRVFYVARGSRHLPESPGYDYCVLEPDARGNPKSFFEVRSGKVRQLVRDTACDVWLIGGWNRLCYWQAALACWSFRKRYAIRGTSHLRKRTPWWILVAKRLILRPFLAQAAGFLAVGRWNAELYCQLCPAVPVFSVPQFFDETRFLAAARSAGESREDVRTRFGFAADDFVILFVGRLAREKNVFELAQAVVNLSRQGVRTRLLIVGQGPLRTELAVFMAEHGVEAVFAGHVPRVELPPIFRCADTLVLPSSSEPWGFVVAEAMTLGVPPVVSDRVGCAPELIVQHRTGIVYRHGDVAGLSAALRGLAVDVKRRETMGAGARRRLLGPKAMKHTVDLFVSAMSAIARWPVGRCRRRFRWLRARWDRWSMVSHEERLLLIRATANLGLTCLKLKLFPIRDHLDGAPFAVDRETRPPTAAELETARRIGWAIGSMSRYTPWESKCLVQSLAARDMLIAEGIRSSVHIGVDKISKGELEAHAWLECGPLIVTGGEERSRFRLMATF